MEIRTEWRGSPDTTGRRFWRLLALSAVLHVPLTPLAALFGLLTLLATPPAEELPIESLEAIPVDLIGEPGPGKKSDERKPPEPAPTATGTMKDPFDELDEDDDADEKIALGPDGGAPERTAKDAGAGDSGSGAIGDPVALSGAAGKIADSNANVRLLIFNDRIRKHPLGTQIGSLLGAAAQWQDFFGPTGLDPIQDIDRTLIAGPQLKDSAQVVAVLKTNVPSSKLKSAVDALVQRDPAGTWLDGGVPAARAAADNAERLIVLPTPDIVVIAPPGVQKQALALGPNLSFPSPQGKEALTTYVITPWRAFVGLPFQVPKTIKWVRMKVIANADGGATATILAEDETPELAAEDAKALTERLNKVTQLNIGIGGFTLVKKSLLDPVTFTAQGVEIHATVTATKKQLEPLLAAIAGYAQRIAQEAKQKAAQKAQAEAGAPAADAGKPSAPKPDAATHEPSTNPYDDDPRENAPPIEPQEQRQE